MWAIIEIGGKQYKVAEGDEIEVEKTAGKEVELTPLMILDDKKVRIGSEAAKAKVKVKILGDKKGEKVTVLKHKSKKRYKVKRGHRQPLTSLKIVKIQSK